MAETSRKLITKKGIIAGYNYIKGKFYVANYPTTTYRTTAIATHDVLQALKALRLQDNTPITVDMIQALKQDVEPLREITYTLQGNGAYIETLTFNGYSSHPLAINCEKSKLYIMNSNTVFNLTDNLSPKVVIIPQLCKFYKDIVGITISEEDMLTLYNILTKFYIPTCYTQIHEEDNTIKYTGTFILSNYTGESPIVYSGTRNPYNTYTNSPIGNIVSIDTATNTIQIANPLTSIPLSNTINIVGTETEVAGEIYTADGTYTIVNIEGNTIEVEETLKANYQFPYTTCSVETSKNPVVSMHRDNSTIEVTGDTSNLIAGDTITITGATITTDFEEISLNGTYTIRSILNNIITVEEEIITDFTNTTDTAYLYKDIFISNVASIETEGNTSLVTLTEPTSLDITTTNTLTIGDTYNIEISSIHTEEDKIVSFSVFQPLTPTNIEEQYPKIMNPVPSEQILLSVTKVAEDLEEEFPTGDLLIDDFSEVQDYIRLTGYGDTMPNIIPSNEVYNNMYKPIPIGEQLSIESLGVGELENISYMTFTGLTSTVFPEEPEGSSFTSPILQKK